MVRVTRYALLVTREFMAIKYDSRKVKEGDTFVAIPGLKQDGAEFIPQALANGAKVIVAEKEVKIPAGVEFRKVSSARRALAELSAEYYGNPSRKLKLIGVTGTKGKTTVTYLIQSILNKAGYKAGLIGTITSAMTTPESADLQAELARLVKEGYTHCVLEVSSHALAQDRVHACHFEVAIFTNLTHDHLDYHKTMDDYLVAKQKLFTMLDGESMAIVNVDDPASRSIIGVVPGEVIGYGLVEAQHELRSTKHNEFDTVVSAVDIREREMTVKINPTEIRTPLIGIHNAYNIAAAFQCGLTLGIRSVIIKEGIEAVKVIPGRQEEIEMGQPFRVIVDFAHSPDSLQKLLETYKPLAKGKLILVFGCPGDRDRAKRPIMGEIAVRLADYTIITTDDPYSEDPAVIIKEIEQGFFREESRKSKVESRKQETLISRKEAIEKALSIAQKGDIVLIVGRGHEKFQDFNGRKVEFDDREVVKNLLKTRKF
ncbi:MAG: UDP-N-acetylmuramoyl-L-alanyl-D-glutamate--2,6-diaminopimelate ligase [Candidatus Margulisbacteria bacterium]|nr:UDP-N-acetylmuramoyl-L-alanyl-D-glutamate--2,6-diaminopimelate ligase [Candidatus Margulisiibacteriota bacterium]